MTTGPITGLGEETSEAIEEAVKERTKFVDMKTLVTGVIVAIVTVVIALYGTDKERASDIERLGVQITKMEATIERLDHTIQERATVEQVDAARESSIRRANSYTDHQVSEIQPVLTRLTVVLERLDEDRIEARDDRRVIRNELQELTNTVRQ